MIYDISVSWGFDSLTLVQGIQGSTTTGSAKSTARASHAHGFLGSGIQAIEGVGVSLPDYPPFRRELSRSIRIHWPRVRVLCGWRSTRFQ